MRRHPGLLPPLTALRAVGPTPASPPPRLPRSGPAPSLSLSRPRPRGPEALARAPEARLPRPGEDGGGCRHRAAVPGHVQAPECGGKTGLGSAAPFTSLPLLSLLLGYCRRSLARVGASPGARNPLWGGPRRRSGRSSPGAGAVKGRLPPLLRLS